MTRQTVPLGRIFGISIGLDYSWFLVFALMTWLHRLKEVPRAQWGTTTAEQLMIPLAQIKTANPRTELWTALSQMDRDGVNQLPVMNDGHVVGMLSREDLLTFLGTLQEIGG